MRTADWWTNLTPRPHTSHRLLCVPHAGGSSLAYSAWPRHMPQRLDVHVLDLPGRGRRIGEPLVESMADLLAVLVPATEPLFDKPCVVFGHSMGGTITMALLDALRAQHKPLPMHVFLAATRPLHGPPRAVRHTLADAELLAYIRSLGGTPEALLEDPEFRAVILRTMRADFRLFETWTPGDFAPLPVPLTIMASPEDPQLTPEDLTPWRRYTTADFHLEAFPGGHFFPHQRLTAVVELMRRRLAAAGLVF